MLHLGKFYLIVIIAVLVSCVFGVPVIDDGFKSLSTNIIPSEIMKGFTTCTSTGGVTGILNCAASRALKVVSKASDEPVFQVLPGITLVSNNPEPKTRTAKELKEENLPIDPQKRVSTLLDLLADATTRFFSERTLKIKFPSTENVARALEEGRGKMKKMMGPLMLGLGAKMVTVVPILLGGLALLASKALLIGKLAFVVSIILFVQLFFSGNRGNGIFGYNNGNYGGYGGYGSTYGTGGYSGYGTNSIGWGTSAQYPYARSFDIGKSEEKENKTAQDLAYSAQTYVK